MGDVIDLRNGDPLHGGRAEMLVAWQGGGIPPSCPAVIRRGTARDPFLGPRGWQAVEHEFHPDKAWEEGGRLVLRFGRELVDNALRDDDIVQISLPALGLADVIAWSGITRSITVGDLPERPARNPLNGPQDTEVQKPTAVALKAVPERPGCIAVCLTGCEPLPSGQGVTFRRSDTTAPVLDPVGWQAGDHVFKPVASGTSDDEIRLVLDLGDAAAAVPSGSLVEVVLPGTDIRATAEWPELPRPVIPIITDPPTGRGRGWLARVLILLVLAAVLAAGGWWWLTAQRNGGGGSEPEVDPGQAAYDRAMSAIEAGECVTARGAMLESIDLGHGPALLAWAERQDSLDFVPCLTETANDVSALDYYQRACAANVEGAPEALRALIGELERQAGAGEGAASDVLRLAAPGARESCGI